jgi:hypothetical protein
MITNLYKRTPFMKIPRNNDKRYLLSSEAYAILYYTECINELNRHQEWPAIVIGFSVYIGEASSGEE